MKKLVLALLIALPFFINSHALADPIGYKSERPFLWQAGMMSDLGTPPSGSDYGFAMRINSSGQIIGDAGEPRHSVLYSNGTMTDLTAASGSQGFRASSLNDLGAVAGSIKVGGVSHPAVYSNGVFTDLGNPGATSSAVGINNSGQVAVNSFSGATYGSFLYSGGTMTALGSTPGHNASTASAINNNGQVVGSAFLTGGNLTDYEPFLYSNGSMTSLGILPGTALNQAIDINDSGQVIGQCLALVNGSGTTTHSWLWQNGTMTEILPAAGWVPGSVRATAINNLGQVVGWAVRPVGPEGSHRSHAFLWESGVMIDLGVLPGETGSIMSPESIASDINDSGQIVGMSIPEPSSVALAAIGLIAMAGFVWRRGLTRLS